MPSARSPRASERASSASSSTTSTFMSPSRTRSFHSEGGCRDAPRLFGPERPGGRSPADRDLLVVRGGNGAVWSRRVTAR